MWINFADGVKNFHNMYLEGVLGIGVVKLEKIGWGRNMGLIANVRCLSLPSVLQRGQKIICPFSG